MVRFLQGVFVTLIVLFGAVMFVVTRPSNVQPAPRTPVVRPTARPTVRESKCEYAAAVVDMVTEGVTAFERGANGNVPAALVIVQSQRSAIASRPQPDQTAMLRGYALTVLDREAELLRSIAGGNQDVELAGSYLNALDLFVATAESSGCPLRR